MPFPMAYPVGLADLAALDFVQRWYLLAGLAGAATPILIHLLTRDRVRKVAFSTIRFFAKANRRVLRRRKLQEMILLAMRVIACALLAVAFARPFLKEAEAQTPGAFKAAAARVIVADVSGSMARPGIAEKLKAEAKSAMESLSEGSDAAALVTFADSPIVEVDLTTRFADIRSKLESLRPGDGGTNIAEAIRRADLILQQTEAKTKDIVLISDVQRTGWRYFKGGWKLSPNVKLHVRAIAPSGDRSNLAVIEADFPQSMVIERSPRLVAARIANYSDADRSELPVSLSVGGKDANTQKIDLRAGGTKVVSFRHVFDSPGDNPGVIRIHAEDAMPADNVFCFNARVIPRMKVVVLNGRPSADPLIDAAAFVALALAPTAADSPFDVSTVPASSATARDLDGALAVILADVGTVAPELAQAIAGVLQRGGGLLFLPGEEVGADAFNSLFGDMAPCRLRRIVFAQTARGEPGETVLATVDSEHPVFEVFYRPHSGDLSTPRFTRYWEVTDCQLSRVLAKFGDGSPAILQREIGGGISMMLVCPVDLRWNDLPRRAIFLPYLHQTVRYLAIRSEKRTAYQVGELLPVPKDHALRDPQGKIRGPGGDKDSLVPAVEPGFYVLRGGAGEFTFAVNRSPAEADPAAKEPNEIVAALQRAEGEQVGPADAGAVRPGRDQDDRMWWYVLLGVTLLLMGELFVGNRTLRH